MDSTAIAVRSYRSLLQLAREQLGPSAARLKTRAELEAALLHAGALVAPQAAAAATPGPLVTERFFG